MGERFTPKKGKVRRVQSRVGGGITAADARNQALDQVMDQRRQERIVYDENDDSSRAPLPAGESRSPFLEGTFAADLGKDSDWWGISRADKTSHEDWLRALVDAQEDKDRDEISSRLYHETGKGDESPMERRILANRAAGRYRTPEDLERSYVAQEKAREERIRENAIWAKRMRELREREKGRERK
tara:strand:- start:456 stop:1013 length:558 start_codon:yes stop_codon:yes gene_type:complete